jgi:hypothetical protein
MARWAIYQTDAGTSTTRPVRGVIDLSDEPSDTLAARLAEQTALLAVNEAVIQMTEAAEYADLVSDADTYDYTVDSTATPPVALTAVTVARFNLEQRQATVRQRRDTELETALQYLALDRILTETDLATVETYVAALRAISDAPAVPESVIWPTLGALANSATATLRARTFRRENILAAVTQSSGVPTGGLIEYGSNSNGVYIRFADGLQICLSIKKAQYVNATLLLLGWTFPAAFVTADSIYLGAFMSTVRPDGTAEGLVAADMEQCVAISTARGTTSGNVQVRSPTYSFVSGDEVWLNLISAGRWI